jgi:hypothetical protein
MVDATATQRLGQVVGRTVWQVRVDNEFTLRSCGSLEIDPRTPDLRLSRPHQAVINRAGRFF